MASRSSTGLRRSPAPSRRASVLVTALLLSAVLGLGVVGYLALSRTALKLAQRTLFLNDAGNLAEAGVEDALYCFNQYNSGASVARAWAGWTLAGANATRTLPPFNRDQNAIGTVKVFVKGCDGSDADPFIISQATITSFDRSPPIVKIIQVELGKNAYFSNGLVGINGLTLRGDSFADSYKSNPTDRPGGPWARYSSRDSRSNTTVAIARGAISATASNTVKGDLYMGSTVRASSLRVTGSIIPDFNGIFPMPEYPSDGTSVTFNRRRGRGWGWLWRGWGSRSRNRNLANVLPQSGDVPASDGRYYYFCDNTTIDDVTISSGANVTIVGTRTDMSSGLIVKPRATCRIYIDGPLTITGRNSGWGGRWLGFGRETIDSGDWAGALQIYTTTTRDCRIDTDRTIYACIYAPNAELIFTGDRNVPTTIVGSFVASRINAYDQVNFIYDESLTTEKEGKIWAIAAWSELRTSSDRSTLGTLTNNFLP